MHPGFTVLLGPDHAGKSSVLTALAADADRFRIVGLDDEHVADRHRVVPALRRLLVHDVLPSAYSADFAMTLMQAGVVHLRDRVAEPGVPGRRLLVDSYYYKILAKCLLLGCTISALGWWREFPRPDRVVWLEVPPEEAWRRAGDGAAVNPLEHYGEHPDRDAFLAYQRDLRDAIWNEIADLPVVSVPVQPDVPATVAAVRAALSDEEVELHDVA